MQKSTHTPGPWQSYNAGATIGTIEGCNGIDVIADIRFIKNESRHNAKLIAAAPDMLDALQAVSDYLGDQDSILADQVNSAIRKARGEA